MKPVPQFGDEYLDMAMRDLHRICTEARIRGVSIAEIDGGEWSECAMIVASYPRSIRRKCFRWLEKVHPHLRFGSGGGNA
jgi:hypothetical protein